MNIDPVPKELMEHLQSLLDNPIIQHIAKGMHELCGPNAVDRIGFEPSPDSQLGIVLYLDVEGDKYMSRLVWGAAPTPKPGEPISRRKVTA